ncbi:hypothetical protein M6B38_150040 [Iris pallida]|uniref:Uncharacterized protein n=1 Tax=Iris pallida TaxID=29817 RepID=A0AAX6F8T2_IRIPA|nr:hypothetical protein M6B38_150040 [Iris pallida]
MIVESFWNLTLLGIPQNPHFYGTYTVGLSPESPFLWDLHCWVIPRIPIFMGLTLLGYPQNHFYGTTMYHLRGLPPFGGLPPSGFITFGVCYIASYNITWLDPCVLIGGTGEYYMFILYSDSLVTASSLCIVDISITVLSLFLYCTSFSTCILLYCMFIFSNLL